MRGRIYFSSNQAKLLALISLSRSPTLPIQISKLLDREEREREKNERERHRQRSDDFYPSLTQELKYSKCSINNKSKNTHDNREKTK